MITPAGIRQRALSWWTDQSFLRSYLAGDDYFAEPKSIGRIGLDDEAELATQFARITAEQEILRQGSREQLGYGYTLHWQTKQKRMLGSVRLIQRITFDTHADWLRFIGKMAEFDRFVDLVVQTQRTVPELEPWLRRYPLRLLENADTWPDWLAVCRYFRDDYVPDRYYVRQLPIPVHTKFLETQQALLLSLLSTVRPALLRLAHKDWRDQLGLLRPAPMIRVRALDERFRLDGQHDDFGLPLPAFNTYLQALSMAHPVTEQTAMESAGAVRRVFICENLLNFLTLPAQPDALALWSGGGFNVEVLADVPALKILTIHYWGDLDAHGFQILNQCRKHFPQTQSLLMNQATFDAHRHLVSSGKETDVVSLPHLTDEEYGLFLLLKRNNWRVEQERLGMEWMIEGLN